LGLGYLLGLREDVVLGGMAVGALVTGLPALILLLWLGTRLAFTPLLIVDPMSNVSSARDAVRASWTVTRPIAWRLAAVLVLMQVGTAFCFILCCFPGILLGLPLSFVVLPATYEMVRIAAMREESAE
jgi:membrane-anchored glycerophosphoryl diester phosphodiesterase (GDPDase)